MDHQDQRSRRARAQKVSTPLGTRDFTSLTGWCQPRRLGRRHGLGRLLARRCGRGVLTSVRVMGVK
jgi:hypothetical protein